MKRDARGEAGHDTFTAAVTMALASLFTLIDLFGPQAIVTVLTDAYGTTPGRMGVAINAATIGMAVTGLMTACIADRIERKPVMVGALFLLAVPTLLLAFAHSLVVFAALRMAQGAFMCAAFTVAVAYIAEEWGPYGTAPVIMSAYVTGNVASNILGRVLTGLAAQYADWSVGFLALAALNVAGGCLLWALLPRSSHVRSTTKQTSIITPIKKHLADSRLRGAFAIGFLILFGFIGVFTYVNFRLADPPFNMSPAALGLLYTAFVFSLLATPAAGPAIRRFGHRTALLIGATTSLAGVILTLSAALPVAIAGLALVGVGTFFSQAVATGYTAYVATQHKAAASGLYLAAYYSGGIIGAIFLGLIYSLWGWHGCVAIIAGSFALMGTVAGVAWSPSAELTSRSHVGASAQEWAARVAAALAGVPRRLKRLLCSDTAKRNGIPNASLVCTTPSNAGAIPMSVTSPTRRHLISVSILLLPMLFASAHTIARAQVSAANDARLYPGDYIAFCTPTASGGCVCSTESQEQALTFPEFSAAVENYVRDVGDTRYARMLDQLRRQCAPSMQTASPR